MFVSVFDVFKVSVGPSSSHTMGPMLAAARFIDAVRSLPPREGTRLQITLYGSLAYTGIGHGTNAAVLAGCLGFAPETYDRAEAQAALAALASRKTIAPAPGWTITLDPETDLVVDRSTRLDAHPNGMRFALLGPTGDP